MTVEFGDVPQPDELARAEALRRHATLLKPHGSLGRLEELGAWVAAWQGRSPPRAFSRPRVIVFAADHGIAAKGVSAYPSEVTGQMVANFLAGGAAINVLAATAGATVRVVDMSVDSEETPAEVGKFTANTGIPAKHVCVEGDAATQQFIAAKQANSASPADVFFGPAIIGPSAVTPSRFKTAVLWVLA